jgi:hypothetical protein
VARLNYQRANRGERTGLPGSRLASPDGLGPPRIHRGPCKPVASNAAAYTICRSNYTTSGIRFAGDECADAVGSLGGELQGGRDVVRSRQNKSGRFTAKDHAAVSRLGQRIHESANRRRHSASQTYRPWFPICPR